MKILVVGKKRGINRVEISLKVLVDSIHKIYFSGFCISKNKILYKIFTLYQHVFYFYILLFKKPNILFYLAMNDDFIWCLRLAKKLKIITIIDIYTLREEIVVNSPKLSTRKLSKSRIKSVISADRFKVYSSNYLIHLSHNDKQFLNKKYPNYDARDFVLPLAIPYDRKFIHKVNDHSCINIVWWGQLSKIHGIDYILSEFENLNEDSYKLHIFDTLKSRVLSYQKINSNKNIFFYYHLNFENGLREWIFQNADIILGLFGDSQIARVVLPNKVIEGLQFNLPIITIESNCYTEFNMLQAVTQCNRATGKLTSLIQNLNLENTIDNSILSENFSVQSFNKRLNCILNEISGS